MQKINKDWWILKNKNIVYTNKTNCALFSSTVGVFSRSVQETRINIKHYIYISDAELSADMGENYLIFIALINK